MGGGRRGLSVQADEAFEVGLDHLGDLLQSGDEAELLEVVGVETVDRAQADGADEDQAAAPRRSPSSRGPCSPTSGASPTSLDSVIDVPILRCP